ncbi:MAG UNVERIFIED_CONTAM: AAA family ATPase [Planctomycetaceae bacterium]
MRCSVGLIVCWWAYRVWPKTLLCSTIARILQLSFRRIQFTPDLMPSDITGTDVLQDDPQTGRRSFQFIRVRCLRMCCWRTKSIELPRKTQAAAP